MVATTHTTAVNNDIISSTWNKKKQQHPSELFSSVVLTHILSSFPLQGGTGKGKSGNGKKVASQFESK
jgi:hypothetical protein